MNGTLTHRYGPWRHVHCHRGQPSVPAAWFFHTYWKIEDPTQRQTQQQSFLRNVAFLGTALAVFAVFASIDHGLRFAVTGSLFHLS